MNAYVPVFRSILKNATRVTWRHRGLWIFGFLAGIVQTGAVTNDILRLAPKLEPGAFSWQTLEDAWNGFSFGRAFIAGLITGTPLQVVLTIMSVGIALIAGIFLVCGAQQLVLQGVHRSAKGKPHLGLGGLLHELSHIHVWRICAIDALTWLAISIVLLGGGVLLRNIITAVPDAAVFAGIGAYLVLLPCTFVISAIGVLTLVNIIRHNDSIIGGFHKATTFFGKHWLFTIEFAAVLFIVNFFITATLGAVFLLIRQVLISFVASTSLIALGGAFLASAVLLIVFIVLVGGMTTVFNYSAWTEFVARMTKKPSRPRSEHVASRVRRAISR